MPTELWEEEALRHVDTMLSYYTAHAISAEILAKDPTKRDKMAKELFNSTELHVRHELLPLPIEEVLALLRGWDEALTKEATTFEQFVRFCPETPRNLQSTGTFTASITR